MSKPLPEDTKSRISELYKVSDQSMGVIAQALGVSERSVRRYKNYSGLGRPRPDHNGRAWPDQDRPSPVASPDGQALEVPGRPSQNETDQALDITERPRPDDEFSEDEGPKTINFVGGKKNRLLEPEKEEFENSCAECGHEFNGDPSHCPNCGIEFEDTQNSKKDNSMSLGRLAIGGGLLVGALILDGLLKKKNQSWSQSSWNNQNRII